MMEDLSKPEKCRPDQYIRPSQDKDLIVQLVLSLIIGVIAFFAFCILRPRWPELFAARKRRLEPRMKLPELPNTMFGWIPKLYRVSEEQVLATAGLDAFVFLNFFKMAARLFATMALFATVILFPINVHFGHFVFDFGGGKHPSDDDDDDDALFKFGSGDLIGGGGDKGDKDKDGVDYFWAYVVFTYLFVAMTIYTINRETVRVVKFRQNYLGSQSTVTDRTFRLTGIPEDLRTEARIKSLIEKLEIGTVESVTICREWKEIDELMNTRSQCLHELESAWAKYLKRQQREDQHQWSQNTATNHVTADGQDSNDGGENGRLLHENTDQPHIMEGQRPQVTLRYGLFKLRSKKLDAIDYYEEKLRRIDTKVVDVRQKHFPATDTAIVTMDSVASCQMVTQAIIDPRPGRVLTKPTPSPSDIVWSNTYAPRGIRRLKSWSITIAITFLTLVWIFPTAVVASWLSICTVRKALPRFAAWLAEHSIIKSLFQNGVPALVVSLFNVAVPYIYDYLSNCQGMISQGDVELSLISKNFFFTFFNTFFVFAVSLTGLDWWSTLQNFLKDTSQIPEAVARDVEALGTFYISFIMLQGIGLMPVRILELGSMALFPIYRMMSATPRDYAELKKPPTFQYGFYLPTALLVFNLCLIYSVLGCGFAILIVGTVYFSLGAFAYKYMVLYAMDQPQHATGGAWRIICYRIIVGVLVFEVVMIGYIASPGAWLQSLFVIPLLPLTVWYSYYFKRRFEPLTRHIALGAIKRIGDSDSAVVDDEYRDDPALPSTRALLRRGSTLDEFKEMGQSFVNPSLISPLEQPWIYRDPPPPASQPGTQSDDEPPAMILPGSDTQLGIGESNVWGSNGDDNV